jgi:hypothetical protein
MKKIKSKEGDIFLIPLRDGSGFGVGLLARKKGNGALGYFFKNKYANPDSFSIDTLCINDIIYIHQFGTPGLDKGSWPIVSKLPGWDRDKWGFPIFGKQDILRPHIYYAIRYFEDFTDDDWQVISEEEFKKLPQDGLGGYGFIELKLTDFLAEIPAI